MHHPLLRFTEIAEATLGRPVDTVVPLMHRRRIWLVAGIGAAAATIALLGAVNLYGPVRGAIALLVAGIAVSALSRQHLLVRSGTQLWLLATKAWHHRGVEVVGEVTRAELSIRRFRFNDFLEIAATRYVLSRVFTAQMDELLDGLAVDDV